MYLNESDFQFNHQLKLSVDCNAICCTIDEIFKDLRVFANLTFYFSPPPSHYNFPVISKRGNNMNMKLSKGK
jgi:hypothetical protein